MQQKHTTFLSVIIFLVGVFVPIVGHILDTILILRYGHRWPGKVLWLAVVWLFPFVGPLLYMLFGQVNQKEPIQQKPRYQTTLSAG